MESACHTGNSKCDENHWNPIDNAGVSIISVPESIFFEIKFFVYLVFLCLVLK